MIKKIYNIILIGVFLLTIFGGGILFLLTPKQKIDMVEKRVLSEMPKFNISRLDPFPKAFDNYYNDHFPFRNIMINSFNKLNFYVLKKSPNYDQVIIGKDGWLFLNGFEYFSYLGNPPLTQKKLKNIEKELEYRQQYCESRGIKLYTIIVPSKFSVYPEKLFPNWQSFFGISHRQQLMEYLKNNKKIQIFDITKSLLDKKSGRELFYHNDNHWNAIGAFYSVEEIMKILKKDFPQLSGPKPEDYAITDTFRNGGNIAQMISMQDELKDSLKIFRLKTAEKAKEDPNKKYEIPKEFGSNDYEYRFTNESAPKLKLLVIRESFAAAQIQFLKEEFGESVFIFDTWKHQLNPEIIEKEKPNIVIIQIMEGFINTLVPE